MLGGTFIELNGQPSSLDACTRYARPGGRVERHFCSRRGTRTFEHTTSGKWLACLGIVEPASSQPVVKVTHHAYVADTGDGGLARPMCQLGGRKVPCYVEAEVEEMLDQEFDALSHQRSQRSGLLKASCHGGAIQFGIKPPEPDDRLDVAWWLSADGTKYLGLVCFCRDCRLESGQSLSVNTYVMPQNVTVQDRSPFDDTSHDKEAKIKSPLLQDLFPEMLCYASSDDVRRSSCGRCGTSIFFERESRPQVVNVAVGILRAESGCLAKEWIAWDWGRIYYKDEAIDKEMLKGLEAQSR